MAAGIRRTAAVEVLRTPDERFADLPGITSRHAIGGRRAAHALPRRGRRDAPVVLLLHGEPSWSYLYRTMIPVAVRRGAARGRAGPDRLRALRQAGRARGLHLPAPRRLAGRLRRGTRPARHHARVPGLGRADRAAPRRRAPGALRARRRGEHLPADRRSVGRRRVPRLARSRRRRRASTWAGSSTAAARPARADVVAAYDAPFPDERYKAGARQFPMLVPMSPDDPAGGREPRRLAALERFNKPFLSAFSDRDPITRGADAVLRRADPRCEGQPHTTIEGGGHFLQEDRGEELARASWTSCADHRIAYGDGSQRWSPPRSA